MGILNALGYNGPAANFLNANRGAITGLGAGMIGNRGSFLSGFGPGLQMAQQGQQIDLQRNIVAQQEQERQRLLNEQVAQKNSTIEAFKAAGYKDLVQAAEAGQMDEAWGEYLKRTSPPGQTPGGFSQTPVFLRDPQGNIHTGQMSSSGGILIDGQVRPGVPPDWAPVARPDNLSSIDLGGYRGTFDPNTGQYNAGPAIQGSPSSNMNVTGTGLERTMAPAPGSPEAITREQKETEAAAQERAGITGQAEEAGSMLDNVDSILEILDDPNTPEWRVVGTFSQPEGAISNTPAGRVRSRIRRIQSGVALNEMLRLKEASATGATGFGQLSERELDILINSIGALNPDNTDPAIFRETMQNIRDRYNRIVQKVRDTVPPEQLRAWGLEGMLNIALPGEGGPDLYEQYGLERP